MGVKRKIFYIFYIIIIYVKQKATVFNKKCHLFIFI